MGSSRTPVGYKAAIVKFELADLSSITCLGVSVTILGTAGITFRPTQS